MSGRRSRRFLLDPEKRVKDDTAKPSEFDVNNAKAARRRARAVLGGCRDLIRAVEDIDAMDRHGLLPDAAERFSAAAEDLRELCGRLRHTLDDVTRDYRMETGPQLSGNVALGAIDPATDPLAAMHSQLRPAHGGRTTEIVGDGMPKPGQHLKLGQRAGGR
ncbi:hypothetical protein CH300_19955 [Rhodococcus sp. 15-1154-1]|nr:hypothetical protein [Rhodococcus sp. 15-1154-1]OZF00819.1 hypothetical protein CH300_19955 [Rhodococcus sp. 15-1154-1]